MTEGISLPRDGFRFRDLVSIANLPLEEFKAACPYPFLLQVPVQLQRRAGQAGQATLVVEPEEILNLVRSRSKEDTARAVIHQVRPRGDEKVVVLGRERPAGLVIDNETVSKAHAEFSAIGALWRVQDLGSSNGTFIDGERLAPQMYSLIRDRGDVRFGTYQALFLLPKTVHKLIQRIQGAAKG